MNASAIWTFIFLTNERDPVSGKDFYGDSRVYREPGTLSLTWRLCLVSGFIAMVAASVTTLTFALQPVGRSKDILLPDILLFSPSWCFLSLTLLGLFFLYLLIMLEVKVPRFSCFLSPLYRRRHLSIGSVAIHGQIVHMCISPVQASPLSCKLSVHLLTWHLLLSVPKPSPI